jgi:hypothetical protein
LQVTRGVAIDTAGNVIAAGYFQGNIGFGASAGGEDIFVAKYSPTNTLSWGKRFGGSSDDGAYAVAVDRTDNSIIVVGFATGAVDFGGACPPTSGGTAYNVFVMKLEPAGGTCVWARRYGDGNLQVAAGVGVDGASNVYVTGSFPSTIDFAPNGVSMPMTSAGLTDVFLAKLDSTGKAIWSQRFGDSQQQNGAAIAVDPAGNSAITGQFWGTTSFGTTTYTSKGANDVFVAKFDASGNVTYGNSFGDSAGQAGLGIAFDSSGAMILTGQMSGNVSFDAGQTTLMATSPNVFLVKLASGAAGSWSQLIASTAPASGNAVAVDGQDDISVTGSYQGTINFGGANGAHTSAGGNDIFVAKLAPGGAPLWSSSYGDPTQQFGAGVAANATFGVAVGGSYQGTVKFGAPVNGTASTSSTCQDNEDAFVLKLAP